MCGDYVLLTLLVYVLCLKLYARDKLRYLTVGIVLFQHAFV